MTHATLTCTGAGFGAEVTTVVPACADCLTGATATFLTNCELEFLGEGGDERESSILVV